MVSCDCAFLLRSSICHPVDINISTSTTSPYPGIRYTMKAAIRARPLVSLSRSCTRLKPRFISSTVSHNATPLAHPAAPGPPPQPPQPAPPSADDSLARKKAQYERMKASATLDRSPNKQKPGIKGEPPSILSKRFWKNVSVKDTPEGYQVLLDSRPVRTASKNVLTIPTTKPSLATAIALEWDLLVSAQQALKQHYIPLTSLTSRALDIVSEDAANITTIRESITRMAMRYLSTDTLLCWSPADGNPSEAKVVAGAETNRKALRDVQMETATPIISYLTTHIWPGVEINPVLEENSIMPTPQPEQTTNVIRGWLNGLPAFELAALERGILASKSLLVATRLLVEWSPDVKGAGRVGQGMGAGEKFGIEEAAEACSLEVTWQTDFWGEVEDTHDVDREDVRRQLGSMILLLQGGNAGAQA